MAREYTLDTASDLGQEQVTLLSELFDDVTTSCLDAVARPGQTCLEIGAGGGSIARWLAARTGPTGRVVAVDLDVDHLAEQPNLDVRQHDVNDGVPAGGPYDLIHARIVLTHLKQRERIFGELVDALAPGGWLVLCDFGSRLPYVVSGASQADRDLVARIMDLAHHSHAERVGISLRWAHAIPGQMAAAGLEDVQAREHSRLNAGGDRGCRYHRNLALQLKPYLLAVGVSEDEVDRYTDLMLEPQLRAWCYQLVCTWGRRPA